MKENKLTIIIDKPAPVVFEFTTNPENTHLWIPSIQKEIAEEYPPHIGTQYKNSGTDTEWNTYKVIEYELYDVFTLSDMAENYHVRYSYTVIGDTQTELEYYEWVKTGELQNPFTQAILENLKQVMENK